MKMKERRLGLSLFSLCLGILLPNEGQITHTKKLKGRQGRSKSDEVPSPVNIKYHTNLKDYK
jgi:hypothetical protein